VDAEIYRQGYLGYTNRLSNSYCYTSELEAYCEWMAGYNDAKSGWHPILNKQRGQHEKNAN